jgi:hypothetical protein
MSLLRSKPRTVSQERRGNLVAMQSGFAISTCMGDEIAALRSQ